MTPGALDSLGEIIGGAVSAHRAAVITDANVGPLYAPRVAASLSALDPVTVTVAPGEHTKSRETWARVTDELLAHGLGRDAVIVALGGGVINDLAGFVAATYLRGVPVVQVPTSLVAMIDAAIGGKTGVDVPAGKNLVGAFHPAPVVIADPVVLRTLPARELRSGLAEALKHGAIADSAYFAFTASHAPALADPANANTTAMHDLVRRSVAIKAGVVSDDPRERGRRKILNFGHTIGHAIETACDYALTHGEAIAVGMVLEARLGEQLGVTEDGTSLAIAGALEGAGLPASAAFDPARIVALTHADKKKSAGRVEYALPARIGSFGPWTTPVEDQQALRAIS